MKQFILLGIPAVAVPSVEAQEPSQQSAQRPNIVWFMAEDLSASNFALYNSDGSGVRLPVLEKMAAEGIVFQNAYSNAPVSSAARTTLITGCYVPRLGASFHRRHEEVPLPDGLKMFPAYLRETGYHTSNAQKTDYNCLLDKQAWSVVQGKMGEWRNRENQAQPFFFVRTNAATHEGELHFAESAVGSRPTHHDPSKVVVNNPHHPDTPLFRYTYATLYDRIVQSDAELGELIEMLRKDGELDNTFIFYFGDNGGPLPGTKGYTCDEGVRVPLVVYVPQKWRERLPVKVGARVEGVVSFMDFAPTVLHMAGIVPPPQMDGKPFLGLDIDLPTLNTRDEAFGYGDRFDELYAFNRTLRKGQFKYSRNFQPYQPKSLYAVYRYRQAAFREWAQMYKDGVLNAVQGSFFEPQGAEELYDLSADKFETRNLVGDPAYKAVLESMRQRLKSYMLRANDLGLLPESFFLRDGARNPVAYGRENSVQIGRCSDIADLQLLPFNQAQQGIVEALHSTQEADRWWAVSSALSFGDDATALRAEVERLLDDPSCIVRSRAVAFLARHGFMQPQQSVNEILERTTSGTEALIVLGDAAYLRWQGGHRFNVDPATIKNKCMSMDWRLDYVNAE